MKKRFVTLLFILIMLVACNGGSVGPMGPPGLPGADGAVGPQGPPGLDGADGIDGQDGADGGFWVTRPVPVDIYCDGDLMHLDAIKDVLAVVKGDQFSCQFKIDNGGRVNEPCNIYSCVPQSAGQPSGYAEFFNGTGRYLGGAGSHGRTVECTSEWKRPVGLDKWGVRIECPVYNYFLDTQLMGGTKYIGKRFPWTANTSDHWHATIVIP